MTRPHALATSRDHELSVVEIDASDLERHPDLIDRILRRELFGVIVRNLFAADRLARVVERIQQDPAMPTFASHTFRGRTYGRVLRMAADRLDEYFDAARLVGPGLEAAFGGEPHYESRLREIVGALSGGRRACVPAVGPRAYAPATVRVLEPGGTIDLHCGNETHVFPPLAELTTLIDVTGEISTLLPLAVPEAGGELEVYDLRHGDPFMDELDAKIGRENAHRALTDRRCLRISPAVGDLALFEEGRYYHRVSEVQGSRARWTMGGFLAPSRDGSVLHYWS